MPTRVNQRCSALASMLIWPLFLLLTTSSITPVYAQSLQSPLIDSVAPDLSLPPLQSADPGPGKRVRQRLPGRESTDLYHTLYLPTDYVPSRSYPVIIEYAGNGNYRNDLGDVSTGSVDGSKLGFGITAGKGAIWVCLPFVNQDASGVAIQWWGNPPDYDVGPTVAYCTQAVPWICEQFNGDPRRVLLVGFSRGAIACNFVGLHDDKISQLWRGFVAYSHYDGVVRWRYPGSDRDSALARLKRLGSRPQFICHEHSQSKNGLSATRAMLEQSGVQGDFTFVDTGFRNHNDAWVLRPSPAREQLRKWYRKHFQ